MSIYGNPIIMGGANGSNFEIIYHDFAKFSGNGYIALPFSINTDYKVIVELDALQYISSQPVFGNSRASIPNQYMHLTQYNNKWYTSAGATEANFTAELTGRHTFVVGDNGHNSFDGEIVCNYTPTTDSASLLVGWRKGADIKYSGRIIEFEIVKISTGESVCCLKPVEVRYKGVKMVEGMLDTVNSTFYIGSDNGIEAVGDYTI